MEDLTPRLQRFVGEPVNAVSFVMDYVELHFNGPVLRLLEPPVVHRPGAAAVQFPGPGSRDALCALIGDPVRAISAVDGGELVLEFASGARVQMSMSQEDRTTPEVLHFGKAPDLEYW
jgi:hypothetical protein